MARVSRIYPALFRSAAIHRGAGPQSVTQFPNHPYNDTTNLIEIQDSRAKICTGLQYSEDMLRAMCLMLFLW